jgi:hypothetical protein
MLNVYNAMELDKGLVIVWRWIVFQVLDFWTYMMMNICLGKYEILLCNVVNGISSL